MSIHEGHRERLKQRFNREGLHGFEDHAVLELLLFYALARVDTNPLAHRLLNKFGSLAAVFDAPHDELVRIEGVGDSTATLIRIIPQVCRRYMISGSDMGSIINSSEEAGKLLVPLFIGEKDEVVYIMCLDGKLKLLKCSLVSRGSVNSVNLSIRKIVGEALACNATSVILAHNHPSGIAVASYDDQLVTRNIRQGLEAVGIELRDHIIVADYDFVSLADSGYFLR